MSFGSTELRHQQALMLDAQLDLERGLVGAMSINMCRYSLVESSRQSRWRAFGWQWRERQPHRAAEIGRDSPGGACSDRLAPGGNVKRLSLASDWTVLEGAAPWMGKVVRSTTRAYG